MSTINSYPPKTAIELQDMDSQARLRQKANKSTTGPSITSVPNSEDSDGIRGKLPKAADEDAETEVDDGFDAISYWAIGASGCAFLAYNTPSSAIGSGLTTLLALGNGFMGVWGWWVGAFGVSAGYRSKKTGADKRTSSFPFKNKYAASEQKKEWKKTHRA
ncbi:hypothetical protein QFC22_003293 [Naganishia vaughanmartiniae]|uniref:Uncharacterized protein n=1 Tax=Naganishia vaughanmartiniae TaxID=1424756 RepID=A0ACC2X850_9TREE|nr:hypothetical protein QFC22_003293 [Naganishia vaughanmartiniae]